MTEQTSKARAKISLSGYLPGAGSNGIDRLADPLADAFHAALDAGDETGETTRVVVVGVLDVATITLPADQTQSRAVNVKFVQIEALTEGDLARTGRLLIAQAKEQRTGSIDQAIDGVDDAIVESTAGTPTAPVEGGRKPAAKARKAPAKRTTRTGRRIGVAGVGE